MLRLCESPTEAKREPPKRLAYNAKARKAQIVRGMSDPLVCKMCQAPYWPSLNYNGVESAYARHALSRYCSALCRAAYSSFDMSEVRVNRGVERYLPSAMTYGLEDNEGAATGYAFRRKSFAWFYARKHIDLFARMERGEVVARACPTIMVKPSWPLWPPLEMDLSDALAMPFVDSQGQVVEPIVPPRDAKKFYRC